MRIRTPVAPVLAALLLLPGCGGSSGGGGSLRVLGASSLSDALDAYAAALRPEEGESSYGGSDELAAQISQGADADVFASAGTGYPAELHRTGLVERPVVFARNRLVVVSPRDGGVASIAYLARPGTKLVIGDPSVPVGEYTRELLERLPGTEREAILANVRSEEAEVGSVLAKVL